jgi:hypothetical protein
MISIQEYDEAEAFAREVAPQLYEDNKWGDIPESHQQLFKVSELSGLQILLNRFQCDRFRTYLYELGGFSRADVTFFAYMRDKIVGMQQRFYPEIEPVVPVETMLSAMCINRKIRTARPAAETILEVGPGAGLNSLLFNDLVVRNYTQVEATQATYLSQAMVNSVCFGGTKWDVWEAAYPTSVWPNDLTRLWHIPWWRLSDLYGNCPKYDVITANACLNEISDMMLVRYMELFRTAARDDTFLLLQDLGAWMYRNEEDLKRILRDSGWFLQDVQTNWDVEEAVGACGHGDAVTTWWLTRREGEYVPRPARRCDTGECSLSAMDGIFTLVGEEQSWDRGDLERGRLP